MAEDRAVRKRVERGVMAARRDVAGNRVRTLVRLPAEPGSAPAGEPRVDPAEELVRSMQEQVQDLRAERDRLLALVEQMAAERRPARRPWPGVRRWWRWLIEGESD